MIDLLWNVMVAACTISVAVGLVWGWMDRRFPNGCAAMRTTTGVPVKRDGLSLSGGAKVELI